ncbi:MAG: glycosyltransferase family 1 protein [Candidatus Buchananbacteria bacterium]|nr:glycosyltransferase family 1 protein [Candidatus Buchananbacteria bacterium]
MIKIALITDCFYSVNGVSKTYQHFARWCQAKKITLDVFTIGEKARVTTKGSVRIIESPAVWPVKYYYDLPPFDTRIISPHFKKNFNPNQYDIFHLATPGSLGLAATILLANSNAPKVGVFHTMLDEYIKSWTSSSLKVLPQTIKNPVADLSQIMVWQLLKWFYSKTDLLLVPSLILKNKLTGFHPRIEIFPRGVDTKIFNPKYKNPRLKEHQPIALYVGRLSTEKNLDLLVEIFKRRADVKLWLAGDGPYTAGLKSQLPNAKFFGYLTGKKLSEIYASADFFIFPSMTDTFGNVILEAQACGLPAIVTTQGGPQELIKHQKTGLIAKPNVKDFNQAINYLITNHDKKLAMSQAAITSVQDKTWAAAFEKLIKSYENLLV